MGSGGGGIFGDRHREERQRAGWRVAAKYQPSAATRRYRARQRRRVRRVARHQRYRGIADGISIIIASQHAWRGSA